MDSANLLIAAYFSVIFLFKYSMGHALFQNKEKVGIGVQHTCGHNKLLPLAKVLHEPN